MSQKKVKQDIEHYKKLLRKQKEANVADFNQRRKEHKREIDWYKNILLALVKKSKINVVVVSPKDIEKIKPKDELDQYVDTLKNIVFGLKE